MSAKTETLVKNEFGLAGGPVGKRWLAASALQGRVKTPGPLRGAGFAIRQQFRNS
jgi:hypothetical protein